MAFARVSFQLIVSVLLPAFFRCHPSRVAQKFRQAFSSDFRTSTPGFSSCCWAIQRESETRAEKARRRSER